jgi:hypothetical protein
VKLGKLKLQDPSTNVPAQGSQRETRVKNEGRESGKSPLSSLEKQLAFVLDMGIWNLEFAWDLVLGVLSHPSPF